MKPEWQLCRNNGLEVEVAVQRTKDRHQFSVVVEQTRQKRKECGGKQTGLVSHGKEFGSGFIDRVVEVFRPRDIIMKNQSSYTIRNGVKGGWVRKRANQLSW